MDDSTGRNDSLDLCQRAKLLDTVQQVADVGAWSMEPIENTVQWTDQVYRIHGVDPTRTITLEDTIEFYHSSDQPVIRSAIERAIDAGETFDEQLRIVSDNGEIRWVRVYGEPVETRFGPTPLYGVFQDITERRRQKQYLDILNRFLRHNIRNEVTVIEGYTEILQEVLDNDSYTQYTDPIRSSSQSLAKLSDKARKLSSIALESEFQPEPTDVRSELDCVIEDLESRYPSAEINASVPPRSWALADWRLGVVAEELLENAIEHAGEPDPLVDLIVANRSDELAIEIRDVGPEIPEMELQGVVREGTQSPLSHGSGLGLWLVKLIVDDYGGDLAYERRDSDGNTFIITLPVPDQRTEGTAS